MALDTTVGGPDSESYISATDASTYHLNHGNDAWSDGSADEQEAALRRATIWLDGRYRRLWKGNKANIAIVEGGSPPEQSLAWPRINVVDDEGSVISSTSIPRAVRYACAEAALRELSAPGSLFPDLGKETSSESVGPIRVTYVVGAEDRTEITIIDDLLSGLLIGDGNTSVTFFNRA
jgi:hypothetical protein